MTFLQKASTYLNDAKSLRSLCFLTALTKVVPVTQVRNDIRAVEVMARAAGPQRLDSGRPVLAAPDRQREIEMVVRLL